MRPRAVESRCIMPDVSATPAKVTTYTNPAIDRSGWPAGPWDDEPDKLSWTDPATDLPCLITRGNPMTGSLCGYVAVEPGHPLHGKDYSEADVEAHGGLTFAAACNDDDPVESAVCHVPEPGKPADVWWFGFDCAHAWDVQPGMIGAYHKMGIAPPPELLGNGLFGGGSYKTVEYVKAECESLAQQLHELG